VQWRSVNKKLMVFELLEVFGFMTDFTSQIEPWDGDNSRGLSKAFPPSELVIWRRLELFMRIESE